jgi:hypothetical protein
MAESWVSRHGTTLIAVGAALVLGIVALVLWKPGLSSRQPAPIGDPSNPGWKIRYDATIALARRGSDKTDIDILEQMLGETTQRANFRTKQSNGQEVVDEQGMYRMLDATLDAIAQYRDKHSNPKADAQLKPAVEKLTESQNHAVREKAKDLLQKLS